MSIKYLHLVAVDSGVLHSNIVLANSMSKDQLIERDKIRNPKNYGFTLYNKRGYKKPPSIR